MNFFVNLILLIILLHQALFWVYFWQLKEYRLDRMLASFETKYDYFKVLKNQFNLKVWFRPKSTFRSIITFIFLFFYILSTPEDSLVLTIIIFPLISFLFVYLVSPPFILIKKYLSQKATKKMLSYKGTVIGITGSYGKSSTKEILVSVLSNHFSVSKTLANNNSEIGVTKTVLKQLKMDSDIFVVEMGAYRRGEIKTICDIVHPQIGIITGIGNQHLSLFKSLDNIKKAKYELIDSLPPDGFSLVAEKDFSLKDVSNIKIFIDHVEFTYQKTNFEVPILGQSLIRNIIAVIKTSQHLGLTLSQIKTDLKNIDPNLFSPKLINLSKNSFIVDNSYNSSIEGFTNVIEYASSLPDYQKIIITPGLIELGKTSHQDHLKLGKLLKSIDHVIVTHPSYFTELNFHKNARLITPVNQIITELKYLRKPKTLYIFQGRIPKVIINSLI